MKRKYFCQTTLGQEAGDGVTVATRGPNEKVIIECAGENIYLSETQVRALITQLQENYSNDLDGATMPRLWEDA